MDSIYIEEQVLEHDHSQRILARFPKAQQIIIQHYGEVFNPKAQNFRTQKKNPSLILAAKQNKLVLPTPIQYETGGGANYYFSHMLNCLYDCRYCFLQGMYRSANYLLFVNYQDFLSEIESIATKHQADEKKVWFFSGYDCDSLAFEPVSNFAAQFVPAFERIPNAVLELRTKSTQVRALLEQPVLDNVVVAYSLSPQSVAEAVEKGAPSLQKRIKSLRQLQQQGWRIGLRFDPIIWHQDYKNAYQQMMQQIFTDLDASRIDSVTLGGFRLPKGFYKTMRGLYPKHWLFSAGLEEQAGMISYTQEIENEMFSYLKEQALNYIDANRLYIYPSKSELTE